MRSNHSADARSSRHLVDCHCRRVAPSASVVPQIPTRTSKSPKRRSPRPAHEPPPAELGPPPLRGYLATFREVKETFAKEPRSGGRDSGWRSARCLVPRREATFRKEKETF